MDVLLDGRLMVTREAVHDQLSEKLDLPEHYGRNLDALYDVLSEFRQNLHITMIHAADMLSGLGSYGNALIKTLEDAAEQFPNVEFLVSSEII